MEDLLNVFESIENTPPKYEWKNIDFINHDGKIDIYDLVAVSAKEKDINNNGKFNIRDVVIVATNYYDYDEKSNPLNAYWTDVYDEAAKDGQLRKYDNSTAEYFLPGLTTEIIAEKVAEYNSYSTQQFKDDGLLDQFASKLSELNDNGLNLDNDQDRIPNCFDRDDDNDGIPDVNDTNPLEVNVQPGPVVATPTPENGDLTIVHPQTLGAPKLKTGNNSETVHKSIETYYKEHPLPYLDSNGDGKILISDDYPTSIDAVKYHYWMLATLLAFENHNDPNTIIKKLITEDTNQNGKVDLLDVFYDENKNFNYNRDNLQDYDNDGKLNAVDLDRDGDGVLNSQDEHPNFYNFTLKESDSNDIYDPKQDGLKYDSGEWTFGKVTWSGNSIYIGTNMVARVEVDHKLDENSAKVTNVFIPQDDKVEKLYWKKEIAGTMKALDWIIERNNETPLCCTLEGKPNFSFPDSNLQRFIDGLALLTLTRAEQKQIAYDTGTTWEPGKKITSRHLEAINKLAKDGFIDSFVEEGEDIEFDRIFKIWITQ